MKDQGILFVALILATMIHGITTGQAFTYLRRDHYDRVYLRLVVSPYPLDRISSDTLGTRSFSSGKYGNSYTGKSQTSHRTSDRTLETLYLILVAHSSWYYYIIYPANIIPQYRPVW